MKRIIKNLVKYLFIFIIVFCVYTFIYHYQVGSTTSIDVENTFIASDQEISEIAGESDGYGVENVGLTEKNINKEGFYIRIDDIDLFKPVVKNVDPRYKEVYVESWETGVSHGKFTSLPDQIGNVYFFAHAVSNVSRMNEENAWFTRIDELSENDRVIIYYNRKKYTYQVVRIYSVPPTATGVYTGVSPVPKITMQTCGPPRGSLDSRYMIEGVQMSVDDF